MPLSSVSATTGILSISSGSLFYSLFISFHFSDDYLPVLYQCLDMEFDCSELGYSFLRELLARLRATREAALFRRGNCHISARLGLTAQRPRQRLCVQRAHGSAYPARADCPRAAAVKSASIVFASLFRHLSYPSTDRVGCRSWCHVVVACADAL